MMLAFVCLVLCVCVPCLEQRSVSVSYTAFSLLLALFSLSLPSFPCVRAPSPSSIKHPSPGSASPLMLHMLHSSSLLSAGTRRVTSLMQSAVSGARCFPQQSAERVASLMTISLSPSPAFSLFVPSCSKPALPLFPRSFSLSRSHTLHTHTRSIPRLVRLLVPTPVA